MELLQRIRGDADRRSALGIVLIAGGLAQIGRSAGNDISAYTMLAIDKYAILVHEQ